MASDIVLAAFRLILAALREANHDPVLVGGLGIQAWGRIRQTKDVDLLLVSGEADRDAILKAAADRGILPDAAHPVVALRDSTILRLVRTDPRYGIRIHVDLIEAGAAFLRDVARRAKRARLFDEDVLLATCEDLILMKLLAGRPIDRADAAELLRLNAASLDRAYLRDRAAELKITPALDECAAES